MVLKYTIKAIVMIFMFLTKFVNLISIIIQYFLVIIKEMIKNRILIGRKVVLYENLANIKERKHRKDI